MSNPQIDVYEDSYGYWCQYGNHIVRGKTPFIMDTNLDEFLNGGRDFHYRGWKQVSNE